MEAYASCQEYESEPVFKLPSELKLGNELFRVGRPHQTVSCTCSGGGRHELDFSFKVIRITYKASDTCTSQSQRKSLTRKEIFKGT